MIGLLLRRLGGTALMLLGALVGTFLLMRVIPSDPAQLAAGLNAPPDQVAKVREALGFNDPLIVQLGRFLLDTVQGNLGTSFITQRSVAGELANYFPATLEVVITTVVILIVVAVPMGFLAAIYQERWGAKVARTIAIMVMGLPTFVVALLLQILFITQWKGVFPLGGRSSGDPPPTVTGLYTVDYLLNGNVLGFVDALWHLALPAIVLALPNIGFVMRFVEAEVLNVLSQDFVRTATAKGLTRARVTWRHILPNALAPILTILGLLFGWLLAGTALVEGILSWPGLGRFILDSIAALDYSPVIFSTLLIAACFAIVNLIVDLLNMAIDPRVRHRVLR